MPELCVGDLATIEPNVAAMCGGLVEPCLRTLVARRVKGSLVVVAAWWSGVNRLWELALAVLGCGDGQGKE